MSASQNPAMSETIQAQTTQWLRRAAGVRGTLVRGIRFPDGTFITDGSHKSFPASALEAAWRVVADAFQVLQAQHLPPARLNWIYSRTILHCAQRADGAILVVIVTRKSAEVDPAGLNQLLLEFQTNVPPAA